MFSRETELQKISSLDKKSKLNLVVKFLKSISNHDNWTVTEDSIVVNYSVSLNADELWSNGSPKERQIWKDLYDKIDNALKVAQKDMSLPSLLISMEEIEMLRLFRLSGMSVEGCRQYTISADAVIQPEGTFNLLLAFANYWDNKSAAPVLTQSSSSSTAIAADEIKSISATSPEKPPTQNFSDAKQIDTAKKTTLHSSNYGVRVFDSKGRVPLQEMSEEARSRKSQKKNKGSRHDI